MKVQAAVLSSDEVNKLAEATRLLTPYADRNDWFLGKEEIKKAVALLREVLAP